MQWCKDCTNARNSCNSWPKHAWWSAQRAYNGQLLQLLRALPSGSIVPFVLVFPNAEVQGVGLHSPRHIKQVFAYSQPQKTLISNLAPRRKVSFRDPEKRLLCYLSGTYGAAVL